MPRYACGAGQGDWWDDIKLDTVFSKHGLDQARSRRIPTSSLYKRVKQSPPSETAHKLTKGNVTTVVAGGLLITAWKSSRARSAKKLSDTPQEPERRIDDSDGFPYTKEEFQDYYFRGDDWREKWEGATLAANVVTTCANGSTLCAKGVQASTSRPSLRVAALPRRTMSVPEAAVGQIIGKHGHRLRATREASGVDSVDIETESVAGTVKIHLFGTLNQVDEAERLITANARLYRAPKFSSTPQKVISIAEDCQLATKFKHRSKAIRKRSGIPKMTLGKVTAAGRVDVLLFGTAAQADAAEWLIREA
jgi:hypothetical protein